LDSRRKCSRCGREASYLLRASGEPLCIRCLERAVIRAIRRAIGEYKALKPGSPLAVVEPLEIPPWFTLSLEVLVKSLKTHGNKIAVLSYSDGALAGGGAGLPSGLDDIRVIDMGVSREYVVSICTALEDSLRSAGCLLKAELILGIEYAKLLGFDVVSLLRPRDLCSVVGMLGIIYMDHAIAIESAPLRASPGATVICPLYNVASTDLAALAYLRGKYAWAGPTARVDRLKEVPGARELLEIYARSPELMYTSSEAVREIFGPGWRRCSICGAPLSSGKLCYMCSHLYPLLKRAPNARG